MDIPQPVLNAIREAAASRMSNVCTAIERAIRDVRALDDFDDFASVLVDHAIQSLVYDARSNLTAIVSAQAAYTGPAKVNVLRSAAVNRVAASVFNHAIGGSVLGDLKGEDLTIIAENERQVACGHEFNAALCDWCLKQGVQDGERVRDVIPERKLKAAYNRLRNPAARKTLRAVA